MKKIGILCLVLFLLVGCMGKQEGVQEEAGQADPPLRLLRDRRGAGEALRPGGPGDGARPHPAGRQPLPL